MIGKKTNEENSKKNFLITTISTIIITLISICYSLTWSTLFIYYIEKKTYPPECDSLISWNRALYIVLLMASGLHLISSGVQYVMTTINKDSMIPKYIMTFKSCLNYITGVILLIGVTVEYFGTTNAQSCGQLKTLTFAYIIVEWTIMGSFMLCVCIVCIISSIFKKSKTIDDNEELSDEENDI